jgi:hypothetical protein
VKGRYEKECHIEYVLVADLCTKSWQLVQLLFVNFVKIKHDTEVEVDARDEQFELEIMLAFC